MADLRATGGAARRAAESLLRSTGGRAVYLRLPASGSEGIDDELGLGTPEFQDVELSPVVFRKARPQLGKDGTRWELMVSAISVSGILGVSGATDADELFAGAFGVMIGERLLEVESACSSDMNGMPYVYRVTLRVPAADVI